MYTLAYDDDALALVAIHGPGGRDDEDFPNLVGSLARLCLRSSQSGSIGRVLISALEGALPPSAAERRELVRLMEQGVVRLALVSRSGVHRTLFFAGSGVVLDKTRAMACTTIDEAADWLTRQTEKESTILRRLLSAAETSVKIEPART
jgi:hypothetical protein